MGIGVQALLLMRFLRDEKLLEGKKSVIELGSQQFAPDLNVARSAMAEYFPDIDPLLVHLPQNLYHLLGVTEYACIDLDGANGAHVFNLNESLRNKYRFRKRFDIVTNHGTTEHAFNQMQCFENVHNLTKDEGLMIHALPSQGYQNHSFFNYHPSFFMDLASANNYEMLGLYYNIGDHLYPYVDKFLEANDTRATENVAVFAVMRKRGNEDFVVPFDGRYYFEQAGKDFKPRSDVGSHGRVEKNAFALSSNLYSPAAIEREPKIKIVVPVWGQQFTHNYVTFNLRQQLASRLLEIDDRSNIEYIIVTDHASSEIIRNSDEYDELRKIARVSFIYGDHLVNLGAYNRLSEFYNLALKNAKVDDLYIFITSDCFFSREVFSSIKRKAESHRVILSPALRVTEDTFIGDVNVSNLFDIGGNDALQLAMRHEHPLTEAFCLNNSRGLIHPLPAQTLHRVSNGYVGRWTVMHPIAIKIANTVQPIVATIDFNYPLFHIRSWSDVAVLDSIEDGLTVSLTPSDYNQGEKFQIGNSRRAQLSNLKTWVTIPWALDYHMATLSHPVRLVTSTPAQGGEIETAEREIDWIVKSFLSYVNARKHVARPNFESLSARELLRPAVDHRQRTRLYGRDLVKVREKIKTRVKNRLLRYAQ